MRFKFCKTATLIFIALAVLLAYPLYAWSGTEVLQAVIASGIIAFVNILLGGLSLEYSINKSNRVFMIAVFGGMGVRMGLILMAVTILLLNDYHALALTLSLMGFYVVFMTAEIIYVNNELSRRSASAKAARAASGKTYSLRSLSADHRSN
jgi:hypothetical protein